MNLFPMVIENSVINKSGLNQQVYSSLKKTENKRSNIMKYG